MSSPYRLLAFVKPCFLVQATVFMCLRHFLTCLLTSTTFNTSQEKNRFLSAIAQITSPPSPQFGQVVQLFLDVEGDVFARITEPSNDDYDNDVSDNN